MIKTIVADPPWNETGGGRIKRGADRHYPLQSTAKNIQTMSAWMDKEDLADDLHFFLWVTNSFLPDGLRTLDALGFKYITNLCWAKDRFGLGYYFRGQHELCLFATRGRGAGVKRPDNSIPGLIHARRRLHSQKPDEFYQLVERRSFGDYLDLFSRSGPRPGWTMKGNQLGHLQGGNHG